MLSIFEKIRFRLQDHCESGDCRKVCHECDFKTALRIVDEVEAEYGNGWIPCSERLPEIGQDCLVTVKYSGFLGMHGFWVKTGHMEAENDWCGDCFGGTVIAWMPLPSPYKPTTD